MRKDVHAPSKINPEDYEYVSLGYQKIESIGDALFMKQERQIFNAHQERTGGKWAKRVTEGNCYICGSVNCIYTVHFYHIPSNTYIRTGMDCAEKLGMGDAKLFRNFRKNVKDALQRQAGKAKAKAMLEIEEISEAWEIYELDLNTIIPVSLKEKRDAIDEARVRIWEGGRSTLPKLEITHEERVFIAQEKSIGTIKSIVETVIRCGNLTEKQIDFIKSLIEQYHNAEKLENDKAEKRSNTPDCPFGKQIITGTVVIKKWQDSGYGGRLVMTVEDDRGFKVWGSVPSKLDDIEQGDKVEFTANIEQSDSDSKFGFFKRPSKAKKLS